MSVYVILFQIIKQRNAIICMYITMHHVFVDMILFLRSLCQTAYSSNLSCYTIFDLFTELFP